MTQWLNMSTPRALSIMYVQAALRRTVSDQELPQLGVRCTFDVDHQHLARYRAICGHLDDGLLPPAYLHVLAFPLQMHLLTANDFPFPLLGLVHLENRIRVLRPLVSRRALRVSVTTENLQAHSAGSTFDVIAEVHDDRGLLWRAQSRLLCRGARTGQAARVRRRKRAGDLLEIAHWDAPADIGRAYARISGDYNPIHLSPLTARLFGFERPIAHGLWNKARVLANMGERLPIAGYEVQTHFHRPLRLPGTASLLAEGAGDSGRFAVLDSHGKRHMEGSWQPIDQGLGELPATAVFPEKAYYPATACGFH